MVYSINDQISKNQLKLVLSEMKECWKEYTQNLRKRQKRLESFTSKIKKGKLKR